jgi:hypothetical protein
LSLPPPPPDAARRPQYDAGHAHRKQQSPADQSREQASGIFVENEHYILNPEYASPSTRLRPVSRSSILGKGGFTPPFGWSIKLAITQSS